MLVAVVQGYNCPDDLYYTTDHAWVRVVNRNHVQMGLTDFTQKMASTLTFVKLPGLGDRTDPNVPIFSYQSAKWVGWVKPPAAGKISAVNAMLTEYPALVNQDPYGQGWVIEIELSEPLERVLARLMSGQAAADWLAGEIAKHGG
ncbi:MAG: glycine cleavage system protein H [Firmicutes bacterium]|nr:glycine cleavage system protein H [Bacillota bacterium]